MAWELAAWRWAHVMRSSSPWISWEGFVYDRRGTWCHAKDCLFAEGDFLTRGASWLISLTVRTGRVQVLMQGEVWVEQGQQLHWRRRSLVVLLSASMSRHQEDEVLMARWSGVVYNHLNSQEPNAVQNAGWKRLCSEFLQRPRLPEAIPSFELEDRHSNIGSGVLLT